MNEIFNVLMHCDCTYVGMVLGALFGAPLGAGILLGIVRLRDARNERKRHMDTGGR